MSLEGDLKTVLGAVVSDRVYPDTTPDRPTFPLIVWQQVGGDAVDFVPCVVASKSNARVQVWVWSKTRLEASDLAHQARLAMVEGALRATTLGAPVSDYNEALKIYGSRTDYSVWYEPDGDIEFIIDGGGDAA